MCDTSLESKFYLRAKRELGQCFLVDEEILRRIKEVVQVSGMNVLEIGPGTGALTNHLVETARTVVAVEIDAELVDHLKTQYERFTNIQVICADFLQYDINWEGVWVVVGNLPYYITSKILFKLFEHHDKISYFYGMVQHEVGKRMIAMPGDKDYGRLSVVTQFFTQCEKLLDVNADAFYPAPRVESMFIRLTFKGQTNDVNVQGLLDFVDKSFVWPRKKLRNNWRSFMPNHIVDKLFEVCEIPDNSRPQEFTYKDYVKMYTEYSKIR